jgi:membrane associated rhomboid family serine protease
LIPLRDSLRSRRFPIITVTLILINFYVFWQELSLSDRALDKLVNQFGVIPAHSLQVMAHGEPIQAFIPLITAMFLHGGWLHLLGNMLYLWVFGDNIEDRMGRFRFLLFYLTVGVCGNLAHIWFDPTSTVPTIGASGAIAGILGAYFICFPRARILTLVPIFIFISIIEIPAVFYLFLWFGLQLINGFVAFGMTGNIVAWWAHIGGFVAGVVLVKLFGKRKDFSYR